MLMYLDPKEYAREGFGENSTYPHTPWLDPDAVVLAGISHKLGDPLTDGLPSLDGIYRKSVRETLSFIPRILLQPISYGTARFLLEQTGGKRFFVFSVSALFIFFRILKNILT